MFFNKNNKNIDFIIAGLGNPGDKYSKTRHNAGFGFMDYLSGKTGIEIKKLKHMALTGKGVLAGKNVLLLMPQTYMNNSGESVADAMRYYKLEPENVLVIFDDCSLELGKIRIRREGSDGGQNGVKSIIQHLHTKEFPRIKIGVGSKPNPDYNLADWVLSKLNSKESEAIAANYDKITEAVSYIINGEIEKAMQLYN